MSREIKKESRRQLHWRENHKPTRVGHPSYRRLPTVVERLDSPSELELEIISKEYHL